MLAATGCLHVPGEAAERGGNPLQCKESGRGRAMCAHTHARTWTVTALLCCSSKLRGDTAGLSCGV